MTMTSLTNICVDFNTTNAQHLHDSLGKIALVDRIFYPRVYSHHFQVCKNECYFNFIFYVCVCEFQNVLLLTSPVMDILIHLAYYQETSLTTRVKPDSNCKESRAEPA